MFIYNQTIAYRIMKSGEKGSADYLNGLVWSSAELNKIQDN